MRNKGKWGRESIDVAVSTLHEQCREGRMMKLAELVGVYDPHEVERERLAARIDRADRAQALLMGGFFALILTVGTLAHWGTVT